jgi:putative ABC transport system permease protein
MSRSSPPRIAQRLAQALSESAHLMGDLEEGYHDRVEHRGRVSAYLWYWRQALVLLKGLGLPGLRRMITPHEVGRDLRYAFRSFLRTPGLAAAGALTLGIGIGGPTAMFGILDGLYARLPVPDAENVVTFQPVDPSEGRVLLHGPAMYQAWLGPLPGVSHVGAYDSDRVALAGDGFSPIRVQEARVTASVLALLAVRPVIGRLLLPEDEVLGAPATALIREDLWQSQFDGSPDVLGQTVRVDGTPHTVIGVLPAGFGFPEQHRLWTVFIPSAAIGESFRVVARLVDGADRNLLTQRLNATIPDLISAGVELAPEVRFQVTEYVLATVGAQTQRMLRYLTFVVSFLVLIAAANVAALLLARGATRTSEIAVRIAIGAGRARVIRQLLLESLILAAGGVLVGLALAIPAIDWFAATLAARGPMPFWTNFGLTAPVLLFASSLMVLATLTAGIVPALRSSSVNISHAMRAGDVRQGRISGRLLSSLVGIEVMLSCALLVLSGLVVKGALGSMQRVGAFPLENVMTGRFVLEDFAYPTAEDREVFYTELIRRLEAAPGVEDFTVAQAMPGDGTSRRAVRPADQSFDRLEDWPRIQTRPVHSTFFEMFDMQRLSGRVFDSGDRLGESPVVVVNEAYAREHLGDGLVIGRSLMIWLNREVEAVRHEVIGVVTDPGVSVDDGRRIAAVFLPMAQAMPEVMMIALHARDGFGRALEVMQTNVTAIDADLPLDRVMTLEAVVRRENDGGRIFGTLFGAFGLSALTLAIVGLHGVVGFTAQQRTRDIGIMRALGARERSLVLQMTGRGLKPVIVGLVLGMGLSWVLAPLMGDGLYDVHPHDPLVLGLVPSALLLGGWLAAMGPAWRAARTSPVQALRAE